MSLSNPTQSADVHLVHSSDQKGNQQHVLNKKKGRNNRRGGNRKDKSNDDKNGSDVGGDNKSKRKVKFPCKLCGGDHLTYLCPHIEDT